MDTTNILLSELLGMKVLNKGTALSAAKYPVSGSFIPVGGMHRFAIFGVVNAADSAVTVQVQQAVTINGTPKDIANAVYVIPADGSANGKIFIIEVEVAQMDINNGYKYVTVDVSGPSGNDTATLVFFDELPAKIPVTNADVISAVKVVG